MLWFIPLTVFVLGLIVGSFLNVVIYRYQTGYTVLGRSECLVCGEKLRWFELIPVASFLFQLGRCRACSGLISWQYPLVELLTGFIFLSSFWRGGSLAWPLFVDWVIFSLLIVITVYDWRHKIIPDLFVYTFIVVALLQSVWLDAAGPGAFVGLALGAFFWLLWFASRGRWLGLGDAKLALGLGLWLGFPVALSAVTLAFWSGALVGLALLLVRGYNIKSEVPFAPFLSLGALLVYLFQFDVFNLLSNLSFVT
ncbi:MAG: prepilin peptidase [Candidatus Vogelbacteria bacterium]|nr:prepilin peptidase [Candidatus Vogelbacteria bacterium]